MRSGFGVLEEQETVYTGHFFDNKKQGKGEMLLEDGRLVKGEWENDILVYNL